MGIVQIVVGEIKNEITEFCIAIIVNTGFINNIKLPHYV